MHVVEDNVAVKAYISWIACSVMSNIKSQLSTYLNKVQSLMMFMRYSCRLVHIVTQGKC